MIAQWIHLDSEKKQRPDVVDLVRRGGEILMNWTTVSL